MADAKICRDHRRARASTAAYRGLARALLAFVAYPKSPRHLLAVEARRRAGCARARRVETVLVMVDPDDAQLGAHRRRCAPRLDPAHGSEIPRRAAEVRELRAKGGIIKALGIARARRPRDPRPVRSRRGYAAVRRQAARRGGCPAAMPLAFDWKILAEREFSRPWLLAGGPHPGQRRRRRSGSPAPPWWTCPLASKARRA